MTCFARLEPDFLGGLGVEKLVSERPGDKVGSLAQEENGANAGDCNLTTLHATGSAGRKISEILSQSSKETLPVMRCYVNIV